MNLILWTIVLAFGVTIAYLLGIAGTILILGGLGYLVQTFRHRSYDL